ncbi:hypothetical protein B0H14DRAFT_3423263 [Mycena olivaceomarginata]|nr:hypothetical protein B0H14DRAFT_3423263 [Mycena olivaceomarginata]
MFSVILYGSDMTFEPPLITWLQALLFMRTLAQFYRQIDLPQCLNALQNLMETAPSFWEFSNCLIQGLVLWALTWDSDKGAPELGEFLLKPGYFPNLKELLGKC